MHCVFMCNVHNSIISKKKEQYYDSAFGLKQSIKYLRTNCMFYRFAPSEIKGGFAKWNRIVSTILVRVTDYKDDN